MLGAVIAGIGFSGQAAAATAAARSFHTVLEDDDEALFSPSTLPAFIGTLRWLGVDELRISAEWKLEAPDPYSRAVPRDVDLSATLARMTARPRCSRSTAPYGPRPPRRRRSDHRPVVQRPAVGDLRPAAAPASQAIRGSTPTSTSASWRGGRECSRSATAAAIRPPERARRCRAYSTFTLWNEPNQTSFLQPQWRGSTAASADWYRSLLRLSYPAIERASPGTTVLIGDTSQSGAGAAGNTGVPPLAFIRRLACVDQELRPITTGSCAGFTHAAR